MIACAWPVSYTLAVPGTWVTGVYVAKLINAAGYQNYITFTVRDDDRNPDLIYQSSVLTYHAYNNFPNDGSTGKSAYDSNSYGADTQLGTLRAVKLSFDRPYASDGSGKIFEWEHDLIKFIEQQGYDVSYTTDIDTHVHPERLLDAKGFLSTGHDEYWSGAMRDGVEAALTGGVNLAFFGANTCYWQVRLQPAAGGVPNREMVIYKNDILDPEPDPAKKTILFRDTGRAEQHVIGVQYIDYGNSNTDFVAQNTSHWIYNGSGLSTGSVVPGIMGYEVDTQFPEYLLPDSVSYTVLGRSPFTGIDYGSVLADTVIYETPLDTQVFASGTLSWSWGLSRAGYVNQGIRTMTKNLLDRFVYHVPDPQAPLVTNPGTQDSHVGDAISLAVAASDPQNDPRSFSAEGLPAGLSIASDSGVISGTLAPEAVGAHKVSVHVTDGTLTTTVNFLWNVTFDNQPELANCGVPSYDPNTDHHVFVWKECGNDAWHVRLAGGGTEWVTFKGTIESSTGFFLVTPVDYEPTLGDSIDTSDPTKIKFTFTSSYQYYDELSFVPKTGTRLCFEKNSSSPSGLTVQVRAGDDATVVVPPFNPTTSQGCTLTNTAPVVNDPGAQSSTLGATGSLQIVASDAESNPLNYYADGLPSGLSIGAATGLISGTVGGSAGVYNVGVQVNDGSLVTTVTFDWTVSAPNTAPQVSNPGAQTSIEGDVVSLPISASDAEGNPLSYSAEGLPPGLDIDPDAGLISGTVGGASATPYSVSVHVSDGSLTTTVDFSWTVNSGIEPDGDVNEDGVVDVADLLLAQRALLGQVTLTPEQRLHGDVAPLYNGIPAPDGLFTLGDVLVIARKVLGVISF